MSKRVSAKRKASVAVAVEDAASASASASAGAAAPRKRSKTSTKVDSSSSGGASSSSSSVGSLLVSDWSVGVGGVGGEVLSFGSGDMSQLGLGSDDNVRERKKPTLLKALSAVRVVRIAAGSLHNAVLDDGGTVHTWGCNDDHALGRGDQDEWMPAPVQGALANEPVAQIVAGASHTLALTQRGEVYSWGVYRDANGVVGFNESVQVASEPMLIEQGGGGRAKRPPVVQIACGENHDLCLTESGEVFQWGDIGIGVRFSDRNKKTKLTPRRVVFKKSATFAAPHIAKVFAGGYSSFAIDTNGVAWVWGPNNYSQTGIKNEGAKNLNITVPAPIPNLPPLAKVASSTHHTLFLTTKGQVYSVGRGEDGRLGHGDSKNYDVPTLIQALNFGDGDYVADIGVGESHSLVTTARGALYTFGYGDLLQLGNGEEEDLPTPYHVTSKELDEGGKNSSGRVVKQAQGGSQHSLILAFANPPRTANSST